MMVICLVICGRFVQKPCAHFEICSVEFGSCGTFVADHWPHWAGGLPDGVPARQGAPGYAEFIAHGQAQPEAVPAETVAQNGRRETTAEQAPPEKSAGRVGGVIPENDHSQDSSVVNGGLY